MKYCIISTALKGTINAPPSKSYTHRAIICASLANGKSGITNYLESNDITETISALRMLGTNIKEFNQTLEIDGNENLNVKNDVIIDCIKESGSTLRFLIPVASMVKTDKTITFIRKGRLKERPVEPLLEALKKLGVECEIDKDKNVIANPGKIKGGKTEISGNISSQFITGLLFACPRFEKNSEITITTEIESKPYLEITLDVLKDFGIEVDVSEDMRKFRISGNQHYKRKDKFRVEGDYSSAAFLLAAGAINGNIEMKNLNINSKQGDREILNILKRMEAKIDIKECRIHVETSELKGIEIDVKNIPDSVPVLAVLGCYAKGETKIYNAERLQLKESDRLSAIATELRKMGANIEELKNGLIIKESKLRGAIIDSHNDHRIAMACAIAGLSAEGETTIDNSECVNKSYPNFFDDLKRLATNKENIMKVHD
ncbi:MAG: 3-phosphoshikimate 1-carboxyvinyltransferase [Candidatus Altiarchaeales archaeon A3]|nr:MAG: 3-phosphoshikimate 1-carboxyvinyltransferase [Candidatus Altiarchaeales archaeon A3]